MNAQVAARLELRLGRLRLMTAHFGLPRSAVDLDCALWFLRS